MVTWAGLCFSDKLGLVQVCCVLFRSSESGEWSYSTNPDEKEPLSFQPPLTEVFNTSSGSNQVHAKETIREHLWRLHFAEYGRYYIRSWYSAILHLSGLLYSSFFSSPRLFPFSVPSLLSCRTFFSSLFSYHHLSLLFPPSLLLSSPPALLPSCPPALLPSCPPPSPPALPCPVRFGFAQYGLTYIFWCLTLPGSFSSIPWPEAVFCVLRGVCLYRTVKTHELILKGIPDILRAEVWLVFSGAINEVRKEECLLCCSLTNKQTNKRTNKQTNKSSSFLRHHLCSSLCRS